MPGVEQSRFRTPKRQAEKRVTRRRGDAPRARARCTRWSAAWPDEPIVQAAWLHNCRGAIIWSCSTAESPVEREWYLRAAVEYGWSRNILVLQIKSALHKREGKSLTNFQAHAPPPGSDLAEQDSEKTPTTSTS